MRIKEAAMLELIPMTLAQANDFVAQHHRHHGRVQGHKFSIGCMSGDQLAGVVIAGRPVGRYLDDGFTLEVTRLCTLGGRNVCSFLYAAAARAAKAMGYRTIITYTLDTETGPVSVRRAGTVPVLPVGHTGQASADGSRPHRRSR